MGALLYTLILVGIEVFLLIGDMANSVMLITFCTILAILATGLLFSINSFLIKFVTVSLAATFGAAISGFDLRTSILLFALYFHTACLWCEIERFFRGDGWDAHYKVSHKMRHNWLGFLCFSGALLSAYIILSEYDFYSPFYSLGLLCLSAVANLAYMEGNRLHNINAFWVDVSKPLSVSGQYWRLILFSTAIFVALGINFSDPLVTEVVGLREYFTQEEVSKGSDEQASQVGGKTTSGFNPGEVTLSNKVDIELSDEKEFYVKVDDARHRRRLMKQPLYMGAQELVIYNGNSWLPKNTQVHWFNDADDGKKDGFTRVGQPQKNSIKQTVYFIKPEMSAVFALPGLHTIQLPEVYMSALGVLGIRPGVAEGNRKYNVYSSFFNYGDIQIDKGLMLGYPGDEYLELPESNTVNKIKALTKKVTKSGMSLLQRLEALKTFLAKNCEYSLKVENKSQRDPLDNFLFHERKGHCLLYASAFTIMLRQSGIPARMVNGFAGGSYDRNNDLFVMKSSNAHAWTEVYFNRYGWVVVDPTPEADSIQPDFTELESFDEGEFSSLNANMNAATKGKGSSFFSLEDTDSIILAACLILVLLSYSWQYLRRIPAFSLKKKVQQPHKFSPKPEYIQSFEKLCLIQGVKLTKAKTAMEMLAEMTSLNGEDEQLQEMVDYYYLVRFADAPQENVKEGGWNKYLAARIKQFKASS